MKLIHSLFIFAIFVTATAGTAFGQAAGSIGGQVTDGLGAVIVGATVTAVAPDGKEKQAISNARGEFAITGLLPGKYTVKAIAPSFALYENTEVEVTSNDRNEMIVILTVAGLEENVDISVSEQISTDPDNNLGATVLKGADLEALPDDPDELEAALQALAGPSAGPSGGQIYIDGFTGGQLPPRESIREIRINNNPFSAEFERLGFGRIEILTRPGSSNWRGSFFGNFNDARLNTRNPFALNRAPSQNRNYGGNVSGPIQKGRSSFFLDINRREADSNSIVNALVLDNNFNITSFNQDFSQPSRRTSIRPRFDFQINEKNTLVARYDYTKFKNEGGIGGTSLPSRATVSGNDSHEIRLTETMIINSKTVNETRFEFRDVRRENVGDNTIPTINVPDAFVGGGAQAGFNFSNNKIIEINNFTTTSFGKNSQHSVKFGGKLRRVSVTDRSENNYGGTFVFPGFFGPDPFDLNGDGVLSPLEQYRANVMGAVGVQYNPSQFLISTGNPEAGVSQIETGLFITDDWRISPALMLSFGLRYENQSNISSNTNFAPRFGFAWSPGADGARAPKTVFRGGAGIFYERFGENLTLNANRNDGVSQLNLQVSANDPDPVRRAAALALLAQPSFSLTGVTNVPTAAQILAVLPASSSIPRLVADDIQAPYTLQATLGVERQLLPSTSFAAYFIKSRSLNQFRSRNINAPICPQQVNCFNAPRPDPTTGNIYQYESSGIHTQDQLVLNFRTNLPNRINLFGNYRLGFAKSDTDGAFSFPSYMYDLDGEFGRSSGDIRHNFVVGGSITLPFWDVSLNPFIIVNSGRPFNITRGVDLNGDGLFTERPTYGQLSTRCSELNLSSSFCNVGSNDPNSIIPRNFGEGPSSFNMNLRVSKNFGFGSTGQSAETAGGAGGGGPRGPGGMMGGRGGMMGGRGGGGGGFGGFGGGDRKPYNLNLSVQFQNLLNTVNLNTPVGNLSSSRFGQSTSTGGGFGGFGGFGGGSSHNRTINLQARFSW